MYRIFVSIVLVFAFVVLLYKAFDLYKQEGQNRETEQATIDALREEEEVSSLSFGVDDGDTQRMLSNEKDQQEWEAYKNTPNYYY